MFGSDELSVLSPGVAELAAKPYVALSPEDARRLQVEVGQQIEIVVAGKPRRYPVKTQASLKPGIAGLPANLPETAGIALPDWFELRRPS